ncbi:MAG: MFS transporter [Hyphomonadaceae bacterium]|nr:MFS transporter [Hyphomonadaceae bacterium]
MSEQALNVEAAVDGQKIGRFNFVLLFWSFLAMFADGFEISALGLAAPHIVREWGVQAGAMGPMMSASLFGILIGAPLFGFIGDRFGRRAAIIWSCAIFGAFTLGVVAAENVDQITWLRFVTGIGMGGLLPNTIALNSEMAPKRARARMVILMFMGITVGGVIPGLAAAWIVPEHGWKALFWIGGALPLLTAAGLVLFLPESVKYLALRQGRRKELVRTLRRMRPDLAITEATEIAAPHIRVEEKGLTGPIFSGRLAAITLLLWCAFSTTLMANYFLNSWMPLLFEAKGLDTEAAALVTSMYHVGAVLGGLTMSFLLDRWGFLAVTGMLAAAAPAMLLVGLPDASPILLGLLVALAGFCVLGGQFGDNAAAGLIYPTAYRAKGVGLAFGAGRIGSIFGPMVGAALIGAHAPLSTLLGVVAATLAAGALSTLLLAWLSAKRFGSLRLDETEKS